MQKEQQASIISNELAKQLGDLFIGRLSIRFLISQYSEFNENNGNKIERGLDVLSVVQTSVEKVRSMVTDKYGMCPEIVIEGNLECSITYVRNFLHHILVELLKNSARAVIERQRSDKPKLSGQGDVITIVISGGKEDCVLKVSDEGGGIPRSGLDKIWSYQYTTAEEEDLEQAESMTFRGNFAGSGYGLPIARVFAKYFGGDLSIVSTEGWGTDAYVYIHRIESSAVETLPD
eukprot:snap_masked-scaffold_148-processed-gene-0.0-mRNA-1 protein AED:0.05 eAED:0.05 QI:0/-1/0/1/-1/1/1/0/232